MTLYFLDEEDHIHDGYYWVMRADTEECCIKYQFSPLQCHDNHEPQGIIEEPVAFGGFKISDTKGVLLTQCVSRN